MFFRGVKSLTVDTKGRVAIPSKYREHFISSCSGELIVTIDKAQCLLIYALPEWEKREKLLVEASSLDPKIQSLQRLYIGYATEINLDSQGRILIPPSLKEYAGLDKSAVLVGQGHRFELWQEQRWLDNREKWLALANSFGENGEMPSSLQNFTF